MIPNAVMSAGGLLCVNVIGLYTGWSNIEMIEEPGSMSYKIQNYQYEQNAEKIPNSAV